MYKTLIAAAVAAATASAGQAASIVEADFGFAAAGLPPLVDDDGVALGSGPELGISVGGASGTLDLAENGFLTIGYDISSGVEIFPTTYTVENIVFDGPAEITGFVQVGGDASVVAGLSFGPDFLRVDFQAVSGPASDNPTFQAMIAETTPVPLPATLPLLAGGIAGLAVLRRRARRG